MEDKSNLVKDIESIITQVQGVISGRLICQDDEIVEIHVLADSSRSPKQVVRDIESAVLVKQGLELDHKKISVAQLGEDTPPLPKSEARLQFSSINYSVENGTAATNITINAGNELYTAAAKGPNTRKNRLNLTAMAALSAVEQSANINGNLILGDVKKLNLCEHEVITVAVCLHHADKTEEILLGTAINKGDDLESTVRATFDAINRKVSSLMSH